MTAVEQAEQEAPSLFDPAFLRTFGGKMRMHRQRRRFLSSRNRFDVIAAGRRCLAEGTLVATPSGPRAIEDLRPGDEVVGFDEGHPVVTTVTRSWDNGVQSVLALTSRRRTYLEATPNHRLWACNESDFDKRRPHLPALGFGRVSLEMLTKRHRVRRIYLGDLIQGGSKSVERTYSLGAMLGDGCCREQNAGRYEGRKTTLTISSDDNVVPDAVARELGGVARKARSQNFSWMVRVGPYVIDAIPFYREWCHGRYAHEKVIDWDEVDTWDRESCLALLAGIIDTDGSIYRSTERRIVVQIGMQSRSVVEACRKIIFKYFQEDLTIHADRREKYKNGYVYDVKTTSNECALRLIDALDPFLRKKGSVDTSGLVLHNVRGDRIGLTPVGRRTCRTFDITVALPSNLYVLHHGGIVTSNSGKTVEAQHRLLYGSFHFGGNHHGCLTPPDGVLEPKYAYLAPTHDQAKRISWERFRAWIPKWALRSMNISDRYFEFVTGARLYVIGMDQPKRVEGIHLDGVVLDEFADMKPEAWTSSVKPALDTEGRPPGWGMFIGRPRGKNHFYKLLQKAIDLDGWGVYYPWPSWLVLSPEKIASARRELDDRSFRQEYGGEFLSDAGRAYYQFGAWNITDLQYDPDEPLLLGFDFNVSPGVAVVAQDLEQAYDLIECPRCAVAQPGRSGEQCHYCKYHLPFETVTAVIDEVWIDEDSNTRRVCERLLEKWGGRHKGPVLCYGDATGGARKTSAERSDWQTIEDYLSRQWPVFEIDVPKANPAQRDRVVVMNSRLRNASETVRIYVDRERCPHLIDDLDMTQLDDRGDLDEGKDKKYTHMSDALGYLVHQRFGSLVTPLSDFETESM